MNFLATAGGQIRILGLSPALRGSTRGPLGLGVAYRKNKTNPPSRYRGISIFAQPRVPKILISRNAISTFFTILIGLEHYLACVNRAPLGHPYCGMNAEHLVRIHFDFLSQKLEF